MLKVHVYLVYPPIPLRQFDWQAVTDDYEPGHPVGSGATRDEAINDLIEQVRDQ